MKILLINLDRDVSRLNAATKQLLAVGIDFVRIPAMDARSMPRLHLLHKVNLFRWWCAVGRPVRLGEIGCALSHYSIYKQMHNEPVCILEDDVILDSRFKEVLEYVEHKIDLTKSQVVLLSNHSNDTFGDNSIHIESAKRDMYTEGYVITPKAAHALLKANLPLQCPCDWWGRWVSRGIIELYHAFPTVCSQDQSQYESSTAGPGIFNVANLGPLPYAVHKCKRVVGKIIDRVLPL